MVGRPYKSLLKFFPWILDFGGGISISFLHMKK